MDDALPLLRACQQETAALRAGRHRPASPRPVTRPGLLLAVGALLVAVTLPAVVQGLQPVPAAAAGPRQAIESAAVSPALNATWEAVDGVPPKPVTARAVAPEQVGLPVRVTVPAAGIDAPLVRLGLQRDGSMRAPRNPDTAAWFRRGPRPGQPGAALLAGHVDSTRGPGAFFRLRLVAPGDRVHVRDEAGRTRVFVVDQISEHRKTRFPTRLVFGGVSGPELRLITCSGSFNPLTRTYSHNLVVYARLADRVDA